MALNLTDVFDKNAVAFNEGHNLIINQGSTGSSKTWSILQLLYLVNLYSKKPLITSICSYALPHLKMGTMREFDKILMDAGEDPAAICNRNEYIYKVGRSLVEFFGIEGNLAKTQGPRRDLLYINEPNRKITYEIFDQLFIRTRICTFMDFNPTNEFWVHTKIIPNFKHALIHSTWRDNQYLSDTEKQNILAKYDKPGFENWVKVYGEGELGILEGQIFNNWRYGEFDTSLPHSFGLDFGFNDPDAMVKIAIDHKRKVIYADEKIYRSGNSYDDLRKLISDNCNRSELITADCADARMINELSRFYNIRPVNKKTMNVSEGLKIMQGYEIIITENSYNLAKELNNYLWNDKKAGIPMPGFDHLIDCMRYCFMENVNPEVEYFFGKIRTETEDDERDY